MINIGVANGRPRVRGFDMTPMIDVVFQLIIFFMFTSQFGQLSRTELELPREAGAPTVSREAPSLVVDIERDGTISVEGRRLSVAEFDAFARRLADRGMLDRGRGVLIRGHRLAPSASLNAVTASLNAAGVARWALGVSNAGLPGAPAEVSP